MPILKDFRNSKTLTLPSFPESKVEIYDSLLVGQMAKFQHTKEMSEIEFGITSLHLFIKSWNFTDENEKALAITTDNLNFLKEGDVVFLLEQITAFVTEGKKKENTTPASPTA